MKRMQNVDIYVYVTVIPVEMLRNYKEIFFQIKNNFF